MSPRARAWNAGILVAALVALVLLYPDFVRLATNKPPANDAGLPPAFAGNRAAYGFALFSLFAMTSLAIRKFIVIVMQLREEICDDPEVSLYRISVALFLVTLIAEAAPDVVLMLLWGEASRETLVAAMTLDRICDGLTIVPFTAAIFILLRAEQLAPSTPSAIRRALGALKPIHRPLYLAIPDRDGLADHVRIVVMVFVIALGLAFLK